MTNATWPRANLIILILGPILILGSVKLLNSVLPAKYYFSLSSLAKGSDEPFIIDTPTVNGQRLCALLRKYGVSLDDTYKYIDQRTNNCSELFAASRSDRYKSVDTQISKDLRDKIYRTAFASDREAANVIQSDIKNIIRTGMSESELQRIFDETSSVSDAYAKILEFYSAQFSLLEDERSQLSKFLKQTYDDVIPTAAAEEHFAQKPPQGSGQAAPRLSIDQINRIKSAHAEFLASFLQTNYLASRNPIDASDIDQIITNYGTFRDLTLEVRKFYTEELSTDIEAALRSEFEQHQLLVLSNDSVRTAILMDVYSNDIFSYVISGLLRILPVFAVAFLFGIYFGRAEILSVSIAGGLAALALVWPIVLLWDTVVQGKWHDYKLTFLGIYALYVLTFFITARAGALAGSAMAPRLGIRQKPLSAVETEQSPKYFSEVIVNVIASVIFSLLVMALNLIVPLKT